MSEGKGIYIFGYSGHSYVIIESLMELGYSVLGYFDLRQANVNPHNLPYMGSDGQPDIKDVVKNDFVFPAVGDAKIRMRLIHLFRERNLRQLVVIDPSAIVSKSASIGSSSYIGRGAIVNAFAQLGDGCIVNTNAVVEHECVVGSGVHIAPGSVICGGVKLGDAVMIGANSVVRQGLRMVDEVCIGAGSVVVKNVDVSGTYFGNPVKLKP